MSDYRNSGEYEGEYDNLCEAAQADTWEDADDPISHECGLDKNHEEAHKCFCGYEF